MDKLPIHALRNKLHNRFNRLRGNTNDHYSYYLALKMFVNFLHEQNITKDIVDELQKSNLDYLKTINIEKEFEHKSLFFWKTLDSPSGSQYISLSLMTILFCINHPRRDPINFICELCTSPMSQDINDVLIAFHQNLVEPLYEYINEKLDDQRVTLNVLKRYKHKCEWFQREELYKIWIDSQNEDTIKQAEGEKKLALHLYEYLYDQGLELSIEPTSISGKIDLIAAQNSDDPLLADAKVFNPRKGRNIEHIARGLNQIYIYAQDYNESCGYLIIFKTCENDLRFSLTNVDQSTPYIIHNHKTFFMIVIDIYPHHVSASKRGKVKAYEITETRLIDIIDTVKKEDITEQRISDVSTP